ncbi:MAG: stage III sporulation protein AE [Clostridia bacterium]|nr:stage III sporulation protein AE [Clostridia bacterium]
MKNIKIKLIFIFFLIIFIVFSPFLSFFKQNITSNTAFATNETQNETQEEIQNEISSQLNKLNFENIEKLLDNLEKTGKQVFMNESFLDKVKTILSGEVTDNANDFFDIIVNVLFKNISSYIPIVATVIAVAVMGGMIENLKPMSNGKSISNIVHFVTYGFIVVLLGSTLVSMIKMTGDTINTINNQMEIIFPILLTMLTAIGGTVSVSVYQPTFALISKIILSIFNYVLMPIFIFSIVFSLVSNMSNNIKLEKFIKFFNSLFKWTIGFIFTIFIGFASLQGISASTVDGLSIRTAKFVIKSYIPILGNYVSDGFNIILASSVLIKNALGVAGLFLIFATIISPIIELIIFMLALKLIAAIIEPLGDKKIASFVSDISKNMSMLVALIVGVSFMYIILVGLVMCSANLG